jgi:cobalt-zinc-cadmium efflux system protein
MAQSHEAHRHEAGGHLHGGGHDHRNANQRSLAIVFGLTTFMVAEIVGGLITGSLALLADAAHMASDSASIGLAIFAFWLSGRPPTPGRSFGYKRAEILATLVNGVTLVAVSIWIFYEAYRRFQFPPRSWAVG